MPSPKPTGGYNKDLADAIKQFHRGLLDPKGRRGKRDTPQSAPITQSAIATCAHLTDGDFSNMLNGATAIPLRALVELSSLPWVPVEVARSWLMLWLANEIDKVELRSVGSDSAHHPILSETNNPGWSASEKAGLVGESVLLLAQYAPTLGVIDQIAYARQRQQASVTNDADRLPDGGPLISRRDILAPVDPKSLAAVCNAFDTKNKTLTALAAEFAQDLTDKEVAERADEQHWQAQVEASESDEADPMVTDEQDDIDALLDDIGFAANQRIEAGRVADLIISLARISPPSQ